MLATATVAATATVGDPLVDGVAGSWADAPAEPVTADAGARTSAPPLVRPAPVPVWPSVLACECFFLPVSGLALWEQFCCVVDLVPPRAGRFAVVGLAGGQVGGVLFAGGAVVVVVVAVAVGVGVGVVGVVVGIGVVGVVVVGVVVVGVAVVVVPLVAPVEAVLASCAPRAAVPPPIQPFSALDNASVLASSESRERQPARLPWSRALRFMPGTLVGVPERWR